MCSAAPWPSSPHVAAWGAHFVAEDQIPCFECEKNYTRNSTTERKQLIARQTIKHRLDRLPPGMFVQLDRRLVLNRTGIASATVSGRTEMTMGKNRVKLCPAAAAARLRSI